MSTHAALNTKMRWLLHICSLMGGCIFIWIYFSIPAATYYLYFGLFIFTLGMHVSINTFLKNLKSKQINKIVYLLFCTALISIACLHADNTSTYGPFVADSINAVYQTSTTELLGYLQEYVSASAIIIAVLWIAVTVLTGISLPELPTLNKQVIAVIAAGIVVGTLMVYVGKDELLMMVSQAAEYKQTLSEFSDSREQVMDSPEYSDIKSDFEGNIIVVIGESSSRHHFGLYNYVRNTTPRLDEIENELYLFSDIISTHSHTVQSLTDALIYRSRTERKKIQELADVVNIAKKANFYTAWLSNQNAVGIWDNQVAAIGRQADLVKYHDPASGTQKKRSVFDMALVQSTQNVLSDKKHNRKLLFVHLMATHFPYCEMMPSDFAKDYVHYDGVKMDYSMMGFHLMSAKQERGMPAAIALMQSGDCYDRAVRYVDSVVRELIESARGRKEPTLLVYFADHGEAPMLGTGHESRMHSHFHVEIPFFVWANTSYKQKYSVKMKNLKNNINKPGSLLDFSYYLSDAEDIKGISAIKSRSIFSAEYQSFDRKTLHGAVGYDTFDKGADYSERTRGNLNQVKAKLGEKKYSKIWAHRVDTMGSMMEAKDLFAGVEMDLVFDSAKKQFFVYHPPAPNLGLGLESQLKQGSDKIRYWFDWKNASKDNFKLALERLESLDRKYKLKDRIILESGILEKSFGMFKKSGWNTSYYLPTDKGIECVKTCSAQQKEKLASEFLHNRHKFGYRTVSFDFRLLEFFDKFMAKELNRENVEVYTWDQGIDISDESAVEKLEPYLNNSNVGVILVNFPSPFDV